MFAILARRIIAFSLAAFSLFCSYRGVIPGDTAPADDSLFPVLEITEKEENALRIMSFNIRFDDVGGVPMRNRRALVLKTIYDADPDSFGVQEATPQWMNTLRLMLPEYGSVGVGRDGGNKGEYSAVFYKKDKYKLVDSDTFWLSETPEVPSKSWNSSLRRICTWAVLENRKTGEQYVHVNSHYDHKSTEAMREAAKLICAFVNEKFPDMPVFFTADMNADPYSQVYRTMTATFKDTRTNAPITTDTETFHDMFNGNERIIDYVMYRGAVTPTMYRVITAPVAGRYVSDHFPLYADFIME